MLGGGSPAQYQLEPSGGVGGGGGKRPEDLDINKFTPNRPLPVPTPNRSVFDMRPGS